MDMSSLSNGLPRPAEDPSNLAFKEAALSLTKLYKAAQGARREGYLDAIDEIYNLFLKNAQGADSVDVVTLAQWINDRRRQSNNMAATQEEPISHHMFDTEPVIETQRNSSLNSSPLRTPRQRMTSPVHRHHNRSDTNNSNHEGRISDDNDRDRERRDRERNYGVKRRVIGSVDIIPDLHKRGRFG